MSNNHVGPYELIAPLGSGGMAETFIAIRRGPAGFEQKVCLKRILPGRAADQTFVDLFLDEARLLARMRCASIVQVYDFGKADDTFYMALELVEGVDLDALLRAGASGVARLPLEASLYIAAQLLSALAYTHDLTIDGKPLCIIHRDISPSNLLLSSHGEVKLTDFGIAKAQGRTYQTEVGYTKGKLPYMSPEQVRGEALDHRTDLFSAGVLLYQLFAGQHPFEASTELALLNNILAGKRHSLAALAPTLPTDVAQLVNALLEVSADGRPKSAAEALASISSHISFIAGQRALASAVTQHLSSRSKSVAASSHRFNEVNQDRPRDGRTQQLQPVASTDERPAHGAKDTTARKSSLRAQRTMSAARMLAVGLALGTLTATGTWAILSRTEDERRPAVLPTPPRNPVGVDDGSDAESARAITPLAAGLTDAGASLDTSVATTQDREKTLSVPSAPTPPSKPVPKQSVKKPLEFAVDKKQF